MFPSLIKVQILNSSLLKNRLNYKNNYLRGGRIIDEKN